MKKSILFYILLLICSTLNAQSTVEIYATSDATITEYDMDINYGSEPNLVVGKYPGSELWLSLLKFDLTSIPVGAVVNSAELRLETLQNDNVSGYIGKASSSWSENTVTMNNAPSGALTIPFDFTGESVFSIDVTSIVKSWVEDQQPNNGLMITPVTVSNGAYWTIKSRESGNSTDRPLLFITFAADFESPYGATQTYSIDVNNNQTYSFQCTNVPNNYWVEFYVNDVYMETDQATILSSPSFNTAFNGSGNCKINIYDESWNYLETHWWTVTVVTSNEPPSIPSGEDPYDGEMNVAISHDLNWSNCSDPEGNSVSYDVYFGTDASPDAGEYIGEVISSFASLTDLNYGTHYYWQIIAKDDLGDSTAGPIWDFYTINDLPDFEVTTASIASTASIEEQGLSWSVSVYNNSTIEAPRGDLGIYYSSSSSSYNTSNELYFNNNGICDPQNALNGLDAFETDIENGTFDIPLAMLPGQWYIHFVADPYNEVVEDSYSDNSIVRTITITNEVPTVPTGELPYDGEISVDLNQDLFWSSCTDPEGSAVTYDVYFGTDVSPDAGEYLGSVSGTSYDLPTLNDNTHYYWKIVAVDGNGGETDGGVWDFSTVTLSNQPSIASFTYTGNLVVGEQITIKLRGENSGASLNDEGYLSLSLPDFSEVDNYGYTTVSGEGMDAIYETSAGTQIYTCDGGQISSDYTLVTGYEADWNNNEIYEIWATITPTVEGNLSIYAKMSIGSVLEPGGICQGPDQQGWPVNQWVIYIGQPDLSTETTLLTPTSTTAGDTISTSCFVVNNGTAVSDTSILKYYLSYNTTYNSDIDIYLGSDTVSPLDVSETSLEIANLEIPSGPFSGDWYILFYSDADLNVNESSENNNVAYHQIAITPLTDNDDIIIQNTSTDSLSAIAGESINVYCEQLFTGNTTSTLTPFVGYYFSNDSIYDGSDIMLGSEYSVLSGTGMFESESETLEIPSGTSSGNYYIIFVADHLDMYDEVNESNNISNLQISVSASSLDLSILNIVSSTDSAYNGSQIELSYDLINFGSLESEESWLRYYLSMDSFLDSSDIELDSIYIPLLGASASFTVLDTLTILSCINQESWYILLFSDADNNIEESNENNNVKYIEMFSLQPPEEKICLITVDPMSGKNKLAWDITSSSMIATYNIYKEVETDIYDLIDEIPYDSLSIYIDYTSSPRAHADKYKISSTTTCGDVTNISPYHKTMNLQVTEGIPASTINLNWDKYIDESGDFIVSKYYILRGSSTTDLILIDSISGSFTSYNDANVYDTYFYSIGVKAPGDCLHSGSLKSFEDDFSLSNIETNSSDLLSDDATLEYLIADGSLISGFDPNTSLYSIFVYDSLVPEIVAVPSHPNASVYVQEASTISESTYVLVTAEDGISVKIYIINYTLYNYNDDATLSNLMIDGIPLSGFDPEITSYTVNLDTTLVPAIVAIPTDYNSSVAITDATAIPGTTTILVTAEDGFTMKIYVINFTFNDNVYESPGNLFPFKIFPNPFSDKTTIEFDNSKGDFDYLILTNITGKEILRVNDISSGKVEIERGDLSSGIYLIELNGSTTVRNKLIID